MRRIDSLLKKAGVALQGVRDVLCVFFSPDDDEFVRALGVDPARYTVQNPDGSTGVDFLAALNDVSAEVWKYEE